MDFALKVQAETRARNASNNAVAIADLMSDEPSAGIRERLTSLAMDRGCSYSVDDLFAAIASLIKDSDPEVIAPILEFIAVNGAKNASRENVAETVARQVFEEHGVKYRKLPSSGKDRMVITSEGHLQNTGEKGTKDIDFAIESGEHILLVTHKFGRVGGGHQNNQSNDALKHMRNGVRFSEKNPGSKYKFVALLDGAYMESKISEFNSEITSEHAFATNMDGLLKMLAAHV